MVDICENIGLKAIALWSTRNENNPMNEEQLIVREYILDDGIIPDDYQVLIINGAYETGINIKDKDIEIVVVNTTDNDTRIQARSRVRKNIKAEIFKDSSCIDDLRVEVPNEYLEKPLTTKDKKELCKDINVYGEKRSLLKWTSLKPIIINSGYEIIDHRITRKKISVSTITDINTTKRILI
ncbi:hypothetical protein [Clostridium sp.]|uniref:hypothetical protein n=1 Tax=Clostridium sp. TaxID=1506 RepID=UPI002FCB8B59